MAVSLVVIIQKMCCVYSFALTPLTLFCSKKFYSDIPCGVFFRVSLVVPGTDMLHGTPETCWPAVHAPFAALPDVTLLWHCSRPSVQATKPSLVILADRKEWMMKTIGLGHE